MKRVQIVAYDNTVALRDHRDFGAKRLSDNDVRSLRVLPGRMTARDDESPSVFKPTAFTGRVPRHFENIFFFFPKRPIQSNRDVRE